MRSRTSDIACIPLHAPSGVGISNTNPARSQEEKDFMSQFRLSLCGICFLSNLLMLSDDRRKARLLASTDSPTSRRQTRRQTRLGSASNTNGVCVAEPSLLSCCRTEGTRRRASEVEGAKIMTDAALAMKLAPVSVFN